MYQIIKDNRLLGLTDSPVYVRMQENGCFGLCGAAEAAGIVWGGSVYHMADREPLDGAGDVLVIETDAGVEISRTGEAGNIMFVAMAEAGSIDNTTAGEHAELFAEWAYPVAYTPGQLRRDPLDGCLYRLNEGQGHTSQQGWNPSLVPALWSLAADPNEEWPEWSQPIGKDDAYKMGAKCSHNGKHWICTEVDGAGNNVWEPGVYGWTEADA